MIYIMCGVYIQREACRFAVIWILYNNNDSVINVNEGGTLQLFPTK